MQTHWQAMSGQKSMPTDEKPLSVFAFMFLVVLLVSPQESVAGWFGPDNREECVDEYIGKAKTEFAARLVYGACSQMFKQASKISSNRRSCFSCFLENIDELSLRAQMPTMIRKCASPQGQKGFCN
mgnify:CR=1 FL=1|jgi:hypothetical protein